MNENARQAVLGILFRAIHVYSVTSALAALSSAKPGDLLPIFHARSNAPAEEFIRAGMDKEALGIYRERADQGAAFQTQRAVELACLVFSHSLADTAIAELCSIAADFDAAYWSKTVAQRKVTLGRVVKVTPEQLLRENIQQKIKTMSLPTKMKLLLQNAGKNAAVDHPRFTYSRTRLMELDRCRHAAVHGEGITFAVSIPDAQEFFFGLTVHAGLVISSMMELEISYPELVIEWVKQLATAGG